MRHRALLASTTGCVGSHGWSRASASAGYESPSSISRLASWTTNGSATWPDSFAICGYQFSPRLAHITDSRMWRIDLAATYGPFDQLSGHRIRLERILAHWPDMLRVAGSLMTGQVRAYDLIRMISRDGPPDRAGRRVRPLRAHLQDASHPAGAARRELPADDLLPAEPARVPPRARPQDPARPPRPAARALPRKHGGSARRARARPQRDRALGPDLHGPGPRPATGRRPSDPR
jgi:hypothetical protein